MRVLDTNILIYYLQDSDRRIAAKFNTWHTHHEKLVVSVITYTEVLSLPSLAKPEIEQIDRFLNTLMIANVDPETARLAALFRRTYRVKLADAMIAATAFLRDCVVVATPKILTRSKI